jgi:hypothetical protein
MYSHKSISCYANDKTSNRTSHFALCHIQLFLFLSVVALSFPFPASAQDQSDIPGVIEGTGIYLKITDSEYLNITFNFDGFLLGKRFMITDRDSKYCQGFIKIIRDSGVRPIRTPPKAPNCNAYAERFVR